MTQDLRRLLTLAVSFSALTGYSQQRTERMFETPKIPHRCADFRLPIDQVSEFHDWLKEFDVVPKADLDAMRYQVNDHGVKVPRNRPYYPVFFSWDGENIENGEVWNPFNHGLPALLPQNVDWATDCS